MSYKVRACTYSDLGRPLLSVGPVLILVRAGAETVQLPQKSKVLEINYFSSFDHCKVKGAAVQNLEGAAIIIHRLILSPSNI